VPWADFNLLKLPAGTEHENNFAMLSDRYGFNYGLVFDEALSMGHGQCPVKSRQPADLARGRPVPARAGRPWHVSLDDGNGERGRAPVLH
jgi:hypothetical protein